MDDLEKERWEWDLIRFSLLEKSAEMEERKKPPWFFAWRLGDRVRLARARGPKGVVTAILQDELEVFWAGDIAPRRHRPSELVRARRSEAM